MITTVKKTARTGAEAPAVPVPVTGLAYVRQSIEAHPASIAHDAAHEASSLCRAIHTAASDAFTSDRDDATAAAGALAAPEVQDMITEASECLDIARDYLRRLTQYDPPF